jgi:hypothetical protein
MEEAKRLKEEGNKLFGSGAFDKAAELYSKAAKSALSEDPTQSSRDLAVICWSNRAQCYLSLVCVVYCFFLFCCCLFVGTHN